MDADHFSSLAVRSANATIRAVALSREERFPGLAIAVMHEREAFHWLGCRTRVTRRAMFAAFLCGQASAAVAAERSRLPRTAKATLFPFLAENANASGHPERLPLL
jgi:hypothetical protein